MIIIHQATGQKVGNVHLYGCVAFLCSQGGENDTSVLVTETEGKKVIPSSLLHFLCLEGGGGVVAAPLSSLTSLSL